MRLAEAFATRHIEKQCYAGAEFVHVLSARPTAARGPKDKVVLRNTNALGDFNHQTGLQLLNLSSIYQMRQLNQAILQHRTQPIAMPRSGKLGRHHLQIRQR
jgi:hypothetical protein